MDYNKILFCIILVLCLFILCNGSTCQSKENLANIDDDNNNKLKKIDTNICSKQCCKFTQWSVPFNLTEGPISDADLQKYKGSNLSCNYGEGSGCVCVSDDNLNYLANRGGNSSCKN
jgi:hypothetical protein